MIRRRSSRLFASRRGNSGRIRYNLRMPSKRLLSLIVLPIAACGGGASTPSAVPTTSVVTAPSPAPAPQTTEPATTTSSTTTTTTTTVPIEVLSVEGERSCPGWMDLARQVGWPEDQLEKLSFVIWRESRCQPDALNGKDPNGGSTGLTQINHYWCKPNRWTPNGWLQDRGALSACPDLFDPEVNLRSALLVWFYSVERHGYGWGPWSL